MLEYQVRTLRFVTDRGRFQIDTGPMLWVDLDAACDDPIGWLWLAHTVYNRRDRAEFARRVAGPMTANGATVAEVYDYQGAQAQAARHTFLAAE